VFRNFPRADIHPHAQNAAEAAEAATAQRKFWHMHDCLFANQTALSNGYLVEYAAMLDLDVNHFLRDIAEDVRVERVRQDVESGIKSGVSTTPTFFINGIRYDGKCDRTSLLTAI
jgi:protein-disulfide isomerase